MRFRFTNLLTFMLLTVQYTYRHHSTSTCYALRERVCVSFCVDDLSTKWSIMCAVCTHIQTRSLIVMCPDRPLLFSFFLLFPRFRCNWLWLKNVCITYTLQLTMSTWCVLFFSLPRMQTATWHASRIYASCTRALYARDIVCWKLLELN